MSGGRGGGGRGVGQTVGVAPRVPGEDLLGSADVDAFEGEAREDEVEDEEDHVADASSYTLLLYCPCKLPDWASQRYTHLR